jgi:hypothetical protein
MKTLGNILLIPIKLILLLGFLISTLGVVLASVFEILSNVILGKIIYLCVIIVLASFVLYGSSLTDNAALSAGLIFFSITIVIAIIPVLFKRLQCLFQKGLSFWF